MMAARGRNMLLSNKASLNGIYYRLLVASFFHETLPLESSILLNKRLFSYTNKEEPHLFTGYQTNELREATQ
jgi:hypothetical protein